MKLDLNNDYKIEVANEYLKKLIEKKAMIELRELRVKRNLDQNGLYWLWLTCIETETQHEKNEIHYLYRSTFLQKEEEQILSILKESLWQKVKKYIQDFKYFPGMNLVIDIISESTTNLDELQFTYYLNEVKKHARVNMGIILLTLKDKNFEAFYREYGFK